MLGGVISAHGEVLISISGNTATGTWQTDKGFKGTLTLKKLDNKPAKAVTKIFRWEEFHALISTPNKFPEGTFFRGHDSSMYSLRTCFHRKGAWDLYRYTREILPELFNYLV
jgi:hypothetical protein